MGQIISGYQATTAHPCGVSIREGWLKSRDCGAATLFRCPVCKTWICKAHAAMTFRQPIPKYWIVMEGYMCGQGCRQRLQADIERGVEGVMRGHNYSGMLHNLFLEARNDGKLSDPGQPPVRDLASNGIYVTDIRFAGRSWEDAYRNSFG